jgi:hypothetical protein
MLYGLIQTLPFLVMMVLPTFVAGGIILAWKRWFRNRNRRSPLTTELLRSPGFGLQEKIDEMDTDIDAYLIMMIIMPLIAYGIWLQQRVFVDPSRVPVSGIILIISACAIFAYVLFKQMKLIKKRQKYREALNGEMATAQLLEPVIAGGGRVFHDVQATGFNIDHVVVAPEGVFAIETKHRLKSTNGLASELAKVRYDGKGLHFPDWVETKPISQARNQADWLSKALTRSTGEPVTVRPVVALPGWFVDRTGRSDVNVINPKNASYMLKPSGETHIPQDQRKRISYQLEQLCRLPDFGAKGAKVA